MSLAYMGPHFMLFLSICVLYSNVTYIYISQVSCLVEIKLFIVEWVHMGGSIGMAVA